MSKSKLVFLLIFMMSVGGIFFISHSYFKNNVTSLQSESSAKQTKSLGFTPKDSYLLPPDYLDSKSCVAFDAIKARYVSLREKVRLTAKTQGDADALWINELQLMSRSSDFKKLEQEALKNDRCSGQTLDLLFNIYSSLKLTEKLTETKQSLLSFADTGNFSAITVLCFENNYALIPHAEEYKYCENIVDNNDVDNNDAIKSSAYFALVIDYGREQKDKLMTLCKKINALVGNDHSPFASANSMCFSKMSVFAIPSIEHTFSKGDYKQVLAMCDKSNNGTDKHDESCDTIGRYYGMYLMQQAYTLFSEKHYAQALSFYKDTIPYDKSGKAAALMATIYDAGLVGKRDSNQAIYWYREAIAKMENNSDLHDFMSLTLNDMGAAYSNLGQYADAFQCYYKSATMGLALGQLHLAVIYYTGTGTIEDNVQAFAWISVAIAQGLHSNLKSASYNKEMQTEAERFKDELTRSLYATGELNEARALAKKYYSEYVLHEQPKQ